MSDYPSYNRSYGFVINNFNAWRAYHKDLLDYGTDVAGAGCYPPYDKINEPTIDQSLMTESSQGNMVAAALEVCNLWHLVCAYDKYYSLELACMYGNLGSNQKQKAKKNDELSKTYDIIKYPPQCVVDATLPTDCNIQGRSYTWPQLNMFLFYINEFLKAKCREYSARFRVLIQVDGKEVGVTPTKKKMAKIIAIVTGVFGGVLVFLSIVFLLSFPRGYNPVEGWKSFVKTNIRNVIMFVIGLALIITAIIFGVRSKGNYVDPGQCSITDLYSSSPAQVSPGIPPVDSRYKLSKDWSGDNIAKMNPFLSDAEWGFSPGNDIDGWDVAKYGQDMTHGSVYYGQPSDQSLVEVSPDHKLTIRVSPVPQNGRRQSVRIHANELYNYGVFAIDVDKIPADATTWPCFWLRGDTTTKTDGTAWSCYGEIDIIEGANGNLAENNRNQCTLHTNALPDGNKCIQNFITDGNGNPISPVKSSDCGYSESGDATCGCDGRSPCPYLGCAYQMAPGSFGKTLNNNGGGVFACELTGTGRVTCWFWPRGDAACPLTGNPSDIDTTKWSTSEPANTIRFNACPGHFQNMALLINTTLCGDWAGSTYKDANNTTISGPAACQGAVNNPDFKYDDGKWVINYVRVYQ